MKLVDIVGARKVISTKATEILEFRLAYKFAKFIKLTNDDEEFYAKHQKELIEQYCKKDDEGNIIPDESGRYQFDNDNVKLLNEKLKELADTDIEIPENLKFSEEELTALKFSIEEALSLSDLIKVDAE